MSVLGPGSWSRSELGGALTDMLGDLHLDHLIQILGQGRDEYSLDQLFTHRLGSVEGVTFRQEVAKDLQVPEVRDAVKEFSAAMRRARKELGRAADRGYLVQQQRHVLEGALVYVRAADRLSVALSRAPLRSAGMRQFGSDLRDLVAAPAFVKLSTAAEGVAEALARVRFRMTISAGTVRITPTRDDLDFTEEITAIFARFRREATSSYLRDVSVDGGVNHVQAGIVDQVARLHPEPFATGINKTGVVVGNSFTVGPDTFTYPDGGTVDVPTTTVSSDRAMARRSAPMMRRARSRRGAACRYPPVRDQQRRGHGWYLLV